MTTMSRIKEHMEVIGADFVADNHHSHGILRLLPAEPIL